MYAFRVFKPCVIHFLHIIWITPTQEWLWGSWWSIPLAMWKYPSGYILLCQKFNPMPLQCCRKKLQMTHVYLLDRRFKSINKEKSKPHQKKSQWIADAFQPHGANWALWLQRSSTKLRPRHDALSRREATPRLIAELHSWQWTCCWWPSPHQSVHLTASVTDNITPVPGPIMIPLVPLAPWAPVP